MSDWRKGAHIEGVLAEHKTMGILLQQCQADNGRQRRCIAEQAAEIARLKEAAIELLDALSEEQYSTTPPKAWPSIAPAANRLSDLVTRLEDS
jgi:hypothetical protein